LLVKERVDRQLRDARAEQAKVHRTHYQLERDILTKERELEEKVICCNDLKTKPLEYDTLAIG